MLRYFSKQGNQNKGPEEHPSTTIVEQASPPETEQDSIISDDDELFLRKVASEAEPPPLPPRRAIISDDGTVEDADNEPQPSAQDTPATMTESPASKTTSPTDKGSKTERWSYWSFIPAPTAGSIRDITRIPSVRWQEMTLSKNRALAADSLQSAAESARSNTTSIPSASEEAEKEAKDLSNILSRMDLSAINNHVVSLSQDTQNLMKRFNQVLRDIINGVPTAYDDLEKLFTERHEQIDKMYKSLPPFLRSLVKSLPTKMCAAFAPQLAAAANLGSKETTKSDDDIAGKDGKGKKKKKKAYIPSLKSLISTNGAVAAMLRSIVSFLELRFPALLAGTNMIMGLAVFVLMFVFWYCHKRGRETRLAKEDETREKDEASRKDLEGQTDLEASAGNIPRIEQDAVTNPLPETVDPKIEQEIELSAKRLEQP